MKKIAIAVIMALTLASYFMPSVVMASPGNLANPGFETGDLSGWNVQQVTDFVGVVTADEYTTPYGSYMLRLGTPRYTGQPIGNDIVYQDFLAVEPTLSFVYNIFTYDYIGYNHFHYLVIDLTTGTTIKEYSQGAWGSGTSLKSTGWQVVVVDLSAHLGHNIRLEIASGGTIDTLYAIWTYVDSLTTPPVALFTYSPEEPKVNQKVTFNASASYDPDGTIVSYNWNFGDGSTGSGAIVEHTYASLGEYSVILTVMDNDGAMDAEAKTITVTQPPPTRSKSLPDPSTFTLVGSGLAAGLSYIGLSRLRRRLSRS